MTLIIKSMHGRSWRLHLQDNDKSKEKNAIALKKVFHFCSPLAIRHILGFCFNLIFIPEF